MTLDARVIEAIEQLGQQSRRRKGGDGSSAEGERDLPSRQAEEADLEDDHDSNSDEDSAPLAAHDS